uniref:Large ribosomal subunit protein bL17 n=1 Tax=Roseihalotalea indica TaxID=2867963 RepID=A0AA49GMM7_9BACT|nr:50S ribosomal protein L17 [Tunicatimonas sp. TK19036]
MRHGKRFNHLGRTAPHRKAMLANMASSLIIHKRLTTTVAKAKALRKYVEPLITRSKVDSTHSRRVVFSYLQDKESSQVLFNDVAERVAERPGGYTRIIKLGNRLGDNAEMCMIELVDFNELYNQEEKQTKSRTRRSRRGGSGSKKSDAASTSSAAADTTAEKVETTDAAVADDAAVAEEETQDTAPEAVTEETAEAKDAETDSNDESNDEEEKTKG